MKWVTLLKDIKEKVGLSPPPSSASSSPSPSAAESPASTSSSARYQHDFSSASPSRLLLSCAPPLTEDAVASYRQSKLIHFVAELALPIFLNLVTRDGIAPWVHKVIVDSQIITTAPCLC